MKVKLTFLETFDSNFNGIDYNIYQFANPVTFDVINGVNLDYNGKFIPYEIYTCYIERRGKKWRVTKID